MNKIDVKNLSKSHKRKKMFSELQYCYSDLNYMIEKGEWVYVQYIFGYNPRNFGLILANMYFCHFTYTRVFKYLHKNEIFLHI